MNIQTFCVQFAVEWNYLSEPVMMLCVGQDNGSYARSDHSLFCNVCAVKSCTLAVIFE